MVSNIIVLVNNKRQEPKRELLVEYMTQTVPLIGEVKKTVLVGHVYPLSIQLYKDLKHCNLLACELFLISVSIILCYRKY